MSIQQIARKALIGAAWGSVCVASLGAQQLPAPLPGPKSPGAGYAYLSLVTARNSQSRVLYDLRYDLCNLTTLKMAFVWEDVGFGMDVTDPLPAGLCATYERSGFGYKIKPDTTLRIESGSQSPPAYLPTQETFIARLNAFIWEKLGGPKQPTSVLSPLHVIVSETNGEVGNRRLQVEWAGSGIAFLAYFPNSNMGVDELKRLVTNTSGASFGFTTFPSLRDSEFLLGAGLHDATIRIEPGNSAQFGTWSIELSAKAPTPQTIRLIVVDEQNKAIARLDSPLQAAVR